MRRVALLGVIALGAWAPAASALPPSITPIVTGQLGENGWYVNDVIVNWTITPPGYLVDFGCQATPVKTDTTGRKVECQASSGPDKSYSSVTIRLDKTAPVVVPTADRPPDGGAFYYNHALTATWGATDPTSGVASCAAPIPYAGPDGTAISLAGTCRDLAGNVSAPVPFVFNYDATPPVLAKVRATAGSRKVTLAWQATGATRIVVNRGGVVVYDGAGARFTDSRLKNGTKYTYAIQAMDPAGNVASRKISVTPSSAASRERLLAPRANARVRRPPLLRWRKVQKASYYNVQVFRDGRKILTAWPTKPRYQLRRSWSYNGQRQVLAGATYRWYLWAGYGKRSARHYGHLLGQRTFKVG
jgi:hypothetical protein